MADPNTARRSRSAAFPARCGLPLLAALAFVADAQTEQSIHWAYGPYFGTGYYRLDAGEETYVLQARPGWRASAAQLDENGRSIGLHFRLPIAFGAYSLDISDIEETVNLDNLSTVSVVPGVEIEVPMGPRWTLKPLGYAGWGTRSDGEASAWIYWAGVKSRVDFGDDRFAFSLINALTYVGYSADGGEHGNSLPLFTAFEFDRPLSDKRIRDEPVRLHWHVGYTSYLNEPRFLGDVVGSPALELDEEWEVGLAFSTGAEPLRLWRFKWDRVGVAYRFGADGDFRGIGLVFGSLFDR